MTVAALAALVAALSGGTRPAPFTEEALARGIDYPILAGAPDASFGVGVAFGDLDGDGAPDLVALGRPDGRVGLYQNDGSGNFTDRFDGSGLLPDIEPSGVSLADYDGDGRLDVYVTRSVASNRLYRNLGGFQFQERGVAAGVADPGAGMGSAWGDVDGDGDLDLYLCNRHLTMGSTVPNRFYRNRGDGTFQEEALAAGLQFGVDPSFQPILCDLDEDGDLDLYVSTDKGYLPEFANHLMRNDGGAFVEVTESSGSALDFNAMGIAVGDFDGDGGSDLYVTNTPEGNGLLLQTAPLRYELATALAGVQSFRLGWSTVFLDFDNDRALDLWVVDEGSPNRLYHQQAGFPCVDVAPALGLADSGHGFGGAVADVDGDGDLDLALANWLDRLRLYVNHEGETRHWLRVEPRAPAPDRAAVGAVVRVRVGARWMVRHVLAGSGYKGQDELAASFGLGDASAPAAIRVLFPGGAVRELSGYGGDRRWRVPHPALLGDADEDGDVDPRDWLAFQACWTGSGAGQLASGCEFADFDGDGDCDAQDMSQFVARLGRHRPAPPAQQAP